MIQKSKLKNQEKKVFSLKIALPLNMNPVNLMKKDLLKANHQPLK